MAKTPTTGWFYHPEHGYMLRGPAQEGWQTVVTALTQGAASYQDDENLWEALKSRLHVNAGCGAIAADEMKVGDHNPAFKPIAKTKVPAWLQREFERYL